MGVVSTGLYGSTDNLLSMPDGGLFVNLKPPRHGTMQIMRIPMSCIALLLLTFAAPILHADDGAASIAAGGLVLMKREPRITMAKEVLRIGLSKVVVDYEFRNDSDQDVTTVVAFPVPPYEFGTGERVFGNPGFDDFKLSIEGAPVQFKVETRAFVGKREITALLASEHIDAASFGHTDLETDQQPHDLDHSSAASRQKLLAAGAFEDMEPNWRVEKKYYWTQTFPARQTVHIRHSYSPVLGGTNSVSYGLQGKRKDPDEKYYVDEINSLCLEPQLRQRLLQLSQKKDMSVPFNYVDFILTTANTWKTPIEDFTLIVDRPTPDKSAVTKPLAVPRRNETLVSFCWNGPVQKTDSMHFTVHATNFVPTKELRVGFISVDQTDPHSF